MMRWLIGVREGSRSKAARVVEAENEDMVLAASQAMIDGGDAIVFVFNRKVDLREIAPVLARGDSIVETFAADIEKIFFSEKAVP